MAEKTELEVVITPEGEVRIVTHGLKGESCLEETASLEKAVGTVRAREKTREFYEKATGTKTSVRNR
jgi:hypothetical protein